MGAAFRSGVRAASVAAALVAHVHFVAISASSAPAVAISASPALSFAILASPAPAVAVVFTAAEARRQN